MAKVVYRGVSSDRGPPLRPTRYQDRHRRVSVMEGPPINSAYLGYSTLSKPATGVGILQQPIRDLYLKFKKPSKGATPAARRVVVRLVPGGLSATLIDPRGASNGELFFDIGSFTYFEVLRFTVLKADKKPKCIFMPLDESKIANKEKAAFVLDKSYASVAQGDHSPLLAAVLRRPKGVKALDCHVFILDNLDDAIHLQSGLMNMQNRGQHGDLAGGDFSRGQHGDFVRAEFGEYGMYRGQSLELKDEHFRSGAPDQGRDPEGRGLPGWEQDPSGGEVQMRGGPGSTGGGERLSGRTSSGSDPMGPLIQFPRQEFERNEMVSHMRQRSTESGDPRFLNKSYPEGEGGRGLGARPPSYSGLPDPQSQPGRYNDKQPPRVADKPMSPTHQFQRPGYNAGPPQQRPTSPRPGQASAPAFSASSAEARKSAEVVESDSSGRPVAKVPPHKVAGIKVLPTGFVPQLKPKSPREDKPREIIPDRNSGDLDKGRDLYKGRDDLDNGRDFDKGRNPESDYDNAGYLRGQDYAPVPKGEGQQDYKANWSRENSFHDPSLRSGFDPPRYGRQDDYGRYPPGGPDPRYAGYDDSQRYGGPPDDRMMRGPPDDRMMRGPPDDRMMRGPPDDRMMRGPPEDQPASATVTTACDMVPDQARVVDATDRQRTDATSRATMTR